MSMHTASEIISLARKLENESAEFYEELSQKYATDEDVLHSFAEENKRNVVQIERVYYGAISDAIEGGFAFDMEADDYIFEASLAQNAGYHDALDKAIKIEGQITRFYSDAAEQSQSLMTDVSRVFKLLTQKRNARRPKLESLLKNT
jgi:rubrerythrin